MKTLRIRSGIYLVVRDITKSSRALYLIINQPNSTKWSLYSVNFNLRMPVISGPMEEKNTLSALKTYLKNL